MTSTTWPAALQRPFRIIAFDWDGTAVMRRDEDATAVRRTIERLLRAGVFVVVITGTSFANVDRQLGASIRGPHKRNLVVATNRGSEVWRFDDGGAPVLVGKRTATAAEERLLTEIADEVRDVLRARTGLAVEVVYDRLNRRKIDIIPAFRDPSKSEIGALAETVEARLRGAGLAGGLREAVDLAERVARARGLRDARVTSDVKHVEVGLTDKGDSIAWIMADLALPAGIAAEDVLIGGDELGPIAGFAGSDSKMMRPEAAGAVVVSVGPEPAGVPPGVIHLGGGPERFRQLLASQAALHPVELPVRPTADPTWRLVEDGFVLAREHELESLFALGNGYLGVRASLAEGDPLSAPATYLAGVFDVPPGGSIPELARMPDWARVAPLIEGLPLRLDAVENLEHRRILDLRQGFFWRDWLSQDPSGRVTTVHGLRLASLADRHVLLQSITLTPENWGGPIVIEGALAGSFRRRTGAGVEVAFAVTSFVETADGIVEIPDIGEQETDRFEVELELGRTYRYDRLVCVYTSRDVDDPVAVAAAHLDEVLRRQGAEGVLAAHRRAWEERWAACDVRVEGDDAAQRALRFAAYHLSSAANAADERSSIGARALTGGRYMGHVFWDTEMFMLPFFTFTDPAAARALLMYRHHTLPAARARAEALGHRGALYAWESAGSGDDVTPPLLIWPDGSVTRIVVGTQEQHISADVAWGFWNHWRATDDDELLRRGGAEVVLETARFWASRVTSGADGRFHIEHVVGPDEYHEDVDDNAYTNVMAQWNLERGVEVAGLLAARWPADWEELAARLRLGRDEVARWAEIAPRIATGFDPESGLFEQFRGFFDLADIDLAEYAGREAPLDVILGRERVQRSQVVKQADVVMLLALLWDRFPAEVREANFRYYEPRTDHGSSLSPPVHALVAARLGDVELAERYFRRTAEIDLSNNMGNAAGGVHAAALGGLWQAAVLGFGGLRLTEAGAVLEPHLPSSWRRLEIDLVVRGRRTRLVAAGQGDAAAAVPAVPEVDVAGVGSFARGDARPEVTP